MNGLSTILMSLFNLLLVVVGFGLVVFIHEMGHFLTARWAGIRVHAFALGFGPAVLSYRKGWGVAKGSSEPAYNQLRSQAQSTDSANHDKAREELARISPTEYRLNALPFGGYVKMMGQSDIAPEAETLAELVHIDPDSYLAKPIWKRMIVISGGVLMNLISAALVFMLVFFVGLKTEPAKIGLVYPSGPASRAVATNADMAGVQSPGLMSGDIVLRVNGHAPDDFNDIVMASAMASPGKPILLDVERKGVKDTLEFAILPRRSPITKMFEIGIEPARTTRLAVNPAVSTEEWEQTAASVGLVGVKPGMHMVQAGTISEPHTAADLATAAAASGGKPFPVSFAPTDGPIVETLLEPIAQLMIDDADPDPKMILPVSHLLGFAPVMKVGPLTNEDRGYEQGLRTGDIFERVGNVEFPSIAAGTREIKRHASKSLDIGLLRTDEAGNTIHVSLTVAVTKKGTIGFHPDDTGNQSTLLAKPLGRLWKIEDDSAPFVPAAAGIITSPGSRILTVGTESVHNFSQLRSALRQAISQARAEAGTKADTVTIAMTLALPYPPQEDGSTLTQTVNLTIPNAQIERLASLWWDTPFSLGVFEAETFVLKASSPIDAIGMGLNRTKNMMVMTYLTLARLVQGTVQVENLKGPVGIAQLGTQVASRGYIWLIFFLGLISVNLAVVNFLPIPIADGGQFLMLLYEQIRGKPLPIVVQNGLTMAGLVLFVSLFLVITYNDIARLFGS